MKNNLLHGAPLYYPSAKEWMWNYCIYLGPYTCNKLGRNYDLGIYIYGDSFIEHSNATVYGNEPGEYMSGSLDYPDHLNEISREVVRRAKLLNLLPTVVNPGDADYPVAL